MIKVIGFFALFVIASSANAALFTFDGNAGNLGTSASFTANGVTITAYGATYRANGAGWGLSNVYQTFGRLGINNSNLPGGNDNTVQIDDSGWYDILAINIPDGHEAVTAWFSSVGSNDDWQVGWNETGILGSDPGDLWGTIANSVGNGGSYTYAPGATNWLYFGPQFGSPNNDDYFLTKLKIVKAVPAPATLLLFGLGLLGLGLVRRVRKS